MKCPSCAARNSEDAAWCTQCYADLRGPRVDPAQLPAPAAPPSSPEHAERDADGLQERGGAADADGATPANATAADIRQRDGEVEWRCATCDGWNPLEAPSCLVCGTERRGFGEPVTSAPRDLSETGVVGASLLLPGLGHVLAGRHGTGFARAILAVLWAFGGLALVVGSAGLGTLPGWVLLASAIGLWAATAVDAKRLVDGDDRELLTTRRLGALVMAVTLALGVAVGIVVISGT